MSPSVSDCIITDYAHSDTDSGIINSVSDLDPIIFGVNEVIPTDINSIASYNFYIYASANGQTTYTISTQKKLVVGCPNPRDITISDAAVAPLTMEMAGMGGSTENIYEFQLPTASQIYCTVKSTQIISILLDGNADDTANGAVFFHDPGTCVEPCVFIDIDPCKVENDITFRIESTFSNSNSLLK